MRRWIEPIAIPLIEYAARSYVAGPSVKDALELANAAADLGFGCTLCYWNDGKEPPPLVVERYYELLDGMQAAGLDAYLAVKIPALLDRADLTAQVVDRARAQGTRIIFDSHAPAQTTTTLEILAQIGGEGVGLAIPGRWRRSAGDVERAIELGASVRVVKGQWPDPDEPDMDLREGYLRIIDIVAGQASHVGIATHDPELAREAIRRVKTADTSCEQELVFPLPIEGAVAEARTANLRSRLYIPFGKAWLPYSLSRARREPRMAWWLLRDFVTGKRFQLPRSRLDADND